LMMLLYPLLSSSWIQNTLKSQIPFVSSYFIFFQQIKFAVCDHNLNMTSTCYFRFVCNCLVTIVTSKTFTVMSRF
jgi:hypothetical protein